jgi:hypothetical protein
LAAAAALLIWAAAGPLASWFQSSPPARIAKQLPGDAASPTASTQPGASSAPGLVPAQEELAATLRGLPELDETRGAAAVSMRISAPNLESNRRCAGEDLP